jgi:hypothetical protein
MKNWKDYVGYQPCYDWFYWKRSHQSIFTLVTTSYKPDLSFSIERDIVPLHFFSATEETVGDIVESLLYTFPEYSNNIEWNGNMMCSKEQFPIILQNKIGVEIANNSKRGIGKTIFESDKGKVIYYNGQSPYDRPIIVSEYVSNDGSTGFFAMKHKNFDKYGYILNN